MMQRPEGPRDVVIAGGSFAGLALALALTRGLGPGLAVCLVERGRLEARAAPRDPRAFALSAGSRSLLEALGVWPGLAAHAQPVSRIDITDSALADALRPVLLTYETETAAGPQMLIVEAERLRSALVEAVLAEPAIEVVAPAEATGLAREGGQINLALGNGRRLGARLVVAADGARSPLRAAAGIGVVGGGYGQHGIAAVVAHERPHDGVAVQHFLPAGPFALLPLKGNRCSVTWSEGEANARRIMALGDDEFLAEVQQRAGWRLGALALAGGRASWPLQSQLARALVAPRLALIGDAARSVHPIAGQGVNLGFRDVAALAEAIADGLRLGLEAGEQTSLARYERWRRSDGVQSSAAFTALNALFSQDNSALRLVRDAGLGIVERLPALKAMLIAEAAGATGEVPRLLKGEAL